MAPIRKKIGYGSAGASGTGAVISKSSSGKSGDVMNFGSKQTTSKSITGKTTLRSLDDKKSSPASFGGKNTSNYSGQNGGNFGGKISSTSIPRGKNTTATFGELGGSSKKDSSELKSMIDKSYVSPSYMNTKNKKSSMTFGIVWLPTRKRNRMKDSVYNPYNNDRRDRSKERIPSMYNFMSGDSTSHQVFKKKEEETDLLVPDRVKVPVTVTAMTSDGLPINIPIMGNSDNNEERKDAGGESYEKVDQDLQNNDLLNKVPDATWETDNVGDKVDSVYLRPSPTHKARSTASTAVDDGEDCGIICLSYTLECCDCVLM